MILLAQMTALICCLSPLLLPAVPEAQPSLSSPRSDASSAFTVALTVMKYRSCNVWRTVYGGSLTHTQGRKSLGCNYSFELIKICDIFSVLLYVLRNWYITIYKHLCVCVYIQAPLCWYTLVYCFRGDMHVCTATKWPQVYMQLIVALWPVGVRMYPSIISISCFGGGPAAWGNLSTSCFQVTCTSLRETEATVCLFHDCG